MKKILLAKSCILLWLVCGSVFPVMAQESRTVEGTVIEKSNDEPIPGASIRVKGTTHGTITDLDGKFSLNVTSAEPILIVSFIGFTSQEIPVGNSTSFTISLESELGQLEEVVV